MKTRGGERLIVDFVVFVTDDSYNYRMNDIEESEDEREEVNFSERTESMKVVSDLLDRIGNH